MSNARRWLRQPDHFDWLSGYLNDRGWSRLIQRGLAVVAASLTLIPINVLWGSAPLDRRIVLLPALAAAIAGAVMAIRLWKSWPTRHQSIAFGFIGSVSIAAGCLWQANPVVGLMTCSALAVSGGYFAFFHAAGYMVANFVIAVATGAVQAVRLYVDGEAVLAVTAYFLVLEINVAMPFAIHAVIRALGIDLLKSDRDPLTGLLNRRALTHLALGRLLGADARDHISVAMVDLDRFKFLNDTRGHAAGDVALTEVARTLNDACTPDTLIGRVGGEEFLLIDVVRTPAPDTWGRRLSLAVAATPSEVTASVGVVTVAIQHVDADHVEQALAQLVAAADEAMYVAKREGGNQPHHRILDLRLTPPNEMP